jgi:general secretion pathway protein G
MVVMVLIGILLTVAVPRYFGSVDKGKLAVQRENIATIRDAIDKYNGDIGKYPETLDALVEKHYLREVPLDPVTEKHDWVLISPPADTNQSGVYDVQSAAKPKEGSMQP